MKSQYFFSLIIVFILSIIINAQTNSILITKSIKGSTDYDIYQMNVDGSNVKLIYNDTGYCQNVRVSSDGKKLVFTSDASTTTKPEIFIMNIGSTTAQQITTNNDVYGSAHPKFYNSTKIWYGRGPQAGVWEWWEMNYDGSGQVQKTNWQSQSKQSAGFNFNNNMSKVVYEKGSPSWSPSTDIYIANIDLTGEQQLTSNGLYDGEAIFSPDGTQIIWSEETAALSGISNIWKMNVDGTNKQNLTNVSIGRCDYPIYSLDGTKIYYSYYDSTQWDIYSMNTDGTNQINITNTPGYDEFAWQITDKLSSNDNNYAYFTKGVKGSNIRNIYQMNVDGSNVKLKYNDAGNCQNVQVSSDGKKLVFTSDASTTTKPEIFIMNIDSTTAQQITTNNDVYGSARPKFYNSTKIWYGRGPQAGVWEWWEMNYDGSGQVQKTNWQSQSKQSAGFNFNNNMSKVVYEKGSPSWSPSTDIYIANIDLTGEQQLTSNGLYDGEAIFSPDGTQIIWSEETAALSGISNIWKMNVDGTNKQNLTNVSIGRCDYPIYSLDGTKIYYSYYDSTQWDIYSMNTDGTNQINITNN
jgi:Tol biopolymer transport system component